MAYSRVGQQKGMKGDLTGSFAVHICAPFWPSPWRQWPYCLKHAGARDSLTGLLSQMTVQVSEVQRLWTHRAQDWPGTCHCHFHALDTWSILHVWVYDHRYHSTGTTLPLSPVPRSKVPIHTNPHLSKSPSQAKRKACCNMKHEYEKCFPWQWHHHGEQSQKADLQLVTLSQDLKCASF